MRGIISWLVYDIVLFFEGFSVLANGSINFGKKYQENFLINRDCPQLNKAYESVPLMLLS